MRVRTCTLGGVLAAGMALGLPASAVAQAPVQGGSQRFVPGEAIVRFEPGVTAAERRDTRGDADVTFDESLRLPRTQVVAFDGPVRAAIERLEGEPGVAYAQPNYRYHATADTFSGQQWGLGALPGVDVLPAWARTRGAGQVIAVLDTGVDLTHPDLAANLWTGPGGIHGFDFVDNDNVPDDHHYHGTHVAGTAAAVADNNIGVAGVAPQAQIMAVRVLDGDGGGDSGATINGIDFAATNGAGVINVSLGGPGADQATQDAITRAELRGSVIVAAAGNEASNNDLVPFSPCSLPNANIVCVAAIDNQSELASYSNFGVASVDVGAPGGDAEEPEEQEIVSTKPAYRVKFNENFEGTTPLDDWTQSGSGEPWDVAFLDTNWASDSPGQYANNSSSQIAADTPVSLTGERACRADFLYQVDTAPGDFLNVRFQTGSGLLSLDFSGQDAGFPFEAALPELDGQASVTPILRLSSDGAGQDNGAIVDDLRIACRGSAPADYDDEIVAPFDFDLSAGDGGGSYMAISGTSMAAPHVAGVAAIVRAADPGAPPAQVVQAIKNGSKRLPSLQSKTVMAGAVDALGAIDAALALPNPQPVTPTPEPTTPARARFGRVSVDRRGVVTMRLRGDAGTSGAAMLTANITAARVRRVARKTFRIGSTGRVAVKLRLSRLARRQLRLRRRLPVRARVVLTNSAGLKSSATARLRVALRRR